MPEGVSDGHCGNFGVCGNGEVYRRPPITPAMCRALAMRINPAGFQEGQTTDCSGCGALVEFTMPEDALTPALVITPAYATCPYKDEVQTTPA